MSVNICSITSDQGMGTTPSTVPRRGTSFSDLMTEMLERPLRDRATIQPSDEFIASVDQSLILQARIYREAERIELVSKLIDHSVGAMKTILQSRV